MWSFERFFNEAAAILTSECDSSPLKSLNESKHTQQTKQAKKRKGEMMYKILVKQEKNRRMHSKRGVGAIEWWRPKSQRQHRRLHQRRYSLQPLW